MHDIFVCIAYLVSGSSGQSSLALPKAAVCRVKTIAFAEWEVEPTTEIPESSRQFVRKIPESILALLPAEVRSTLPGEVAVLRNWDFVDICAGAARIAKWCVTAGLKGAAIDVEYGQHMDINSPEGFALAVLAVLRVKPGGMVFAAAQCSSWVWISRGASKRSLDNVLGYACLVNDRTPAHETRGTRAVCM